MKATFRLTAATTREACEALNCHPQSVRSWAKRGLIRAFKTAGGHGHWRFDVADYLARQEVGAQPQLPNAA